MLEHSQIAPYLLERELIGPRAVVEGELTVVDVSRRHRVFVAAAREGPAFVVKQGELSHEAAVLRSLANVPELRAHIPRVAVHDPSAAVLVLTSPGGGSDYVHVHQGGRFPLWTARLLGRTLARLHALARDAVPARAADMDPAWVLSLDAPSHALVAEMSPGALDVLERVQASREVCSALEAVREEDDACVHGDVRWDNCVALPGRGLVLVDWEYAGSGSAAFDAGGVLAEYLRVWVGSIPIAGDPGGMLDLARLPLARMRPAIAAFWDGYGARGGVERVVRMTSARLLQIALERAQRLVRPTAEIMVLVQVAANMLARPREAGRDLLGL